MTRVFFLLMAVFLPAPVLAQDLSFDANGTDECLFTTGHEGNKADCIGVSAGNCMQQPGGDSTFGMGFCLDNELQYWDDKLNGAYQQLRDVMQMSDASLPDNLAVQADTLRDMQRAWITYRDARCGHEASLWQGGTGASPAFLNCMMHLTAEQALYLFALYSGEG